MTQDPKTLGFSADPELGEVVVAKSSMKNAIVGGVVLLLLGLGILLGAFGAWHSHASGPGPGGSGTWTGRAIIVTLSLLMFVGAGVAFHRAGLTFVFYDLGVALHRKARRLKSIRYADADELVMKQARMYHNGVYTGTNVTLKWSQGGRKLFAYSGTYKETMQKGGLLTMLRQQFVEAPTDLDAVRDIAAGTLSPRFVESLARGETLELGSRHLASAQGLTPAGGPFKGQLVPYAAIEDMQVNNFKLHVMVGGKEIITCPTNTPNFWPKYYAMQEFWLAAIEAGNTAGHADVQTS